jgi:Holliday junction resolvase
VNRSKIKGTKAESAVRSYLQAHGFPHAERLALSGAADRGDITGTPGLCIEVKDTKAADWGGQLRETVTERDNAKARHGVLVRKRRGHVDPARWYAVMEFEDWVRLVRAAGFGDPLE